MTKKAIYIAVFLFMLALLISYFMNRDTANTERQPTPQEIKIDGRQTQAYMEE